MVRLRKKAHQIPLQKPAGPEDKDNMAGNEGLRVGGTGSWSVRTQWIFFAMASGACAAFNGVFAKLTTTDLTTTLSQSVANALGLANIENIVEYVVRGMFFGLNLLFNAIMWSLFTTALARGTSTTQVSIMNTSANFIITALMGYFIFSESLPGLWWVGAAFLVAGNVIIGRKDETAGEDDAGYSAVPQADGAEREGEADARKDDEDEDVIDLGDLAEERR